MSKDKIDRLVEQFPQVWKTRAAFFAWLQHNIHKEVFCGIEEPGTVLPDITCFEDVADFVLKAVFVKPPKMLPRTSTLPGVVYWLHTFEQKDPLVEGYVGVASSLEVRLAQHRYQCLTNSPHHRKHKGLVQAFRADSIIADTLFTGEYSQCLVLEREMRPASYIGWNLAVGGDGGTAKHGLTGTKIAKTFYNIRTKAIRGGTDFYWEGKLEEFAVFYNETKPSESGYVLTRKDVTKGWFPENIVWTTHKQAIRLSAKETSIHQIGNLRGTLGELAVACGLKPNTVSCRRRDGWTLEEALGLTERGNHG